MFNENPIFEFRGPWGVPVQIGPSLILLILVFVSFDRGAEAFYYSAIYFGVLVGSIFLHEFGHAWGCLVQGVPVRRVMIFGGGGFCERARSSTAHQDELIVAMGPIVNLVLWAVASLAVPYAAGDLAWVLAVIARLNLFLALFNLIPVMPLDGGKLFHLLMLRLMPSRLATQVAGGVGLVFAVLWIPLMYVAWMQMGFVLLFFPPVMIHWRMLTQQTI